MADLLKVRDFAHSDVITTKKLETLDLPLIQSVTNWFTGSYVFFDIVSPDAKTLAIASYDEKLFSVRNVATQKTQTISGRHVF